MKRELDLARQLLLDIESRGPDCSVSVLRPNVNHSSVANHESEERIRYHLRLLIDAGLLKEVDRTTAGIPCVRLTHEGHELLELARHENLWREAKWLCQERTGGLSLTVIRTFMVRLAVGPSGTLPRTRRTYLARRPRLETDRIEPIRYLQREDADEMLDADRYRYVRIRPEMTDHYDRPLSYVSDWDEEPRLNGEFETTFPTQLI
ncbi:DUF2513 domain-containing protein [Bythopirellula polymerisocia]|uniref:DUF2513 domain-containing protein n=1 Tax=Bythopirellula polymerisocia TaxID=2528003 RepID=A0A5C6CUN2_9BACT|nr:DUF2513 domain-containing protein [Bythopirellula polymerisocia]TWU28280.1 hypothetical protein Pla144_15670 [Bythopirellula polymerisocia]